MNDELETALKKIQQSIDAWEEQKCRETASVLQMQLTILKLLCGVEKFNELDAFVRYLKEATEYLNASSRPVVENGVLKL